MPDPEPHGSAFISLLDPDPLSKKLLDPDPQKMNADPQPCFSWLDSLKGEFLSSVFHVLPLIYPMFTVYLSGSGSVFSKLYPDPQNC